MVFHILMMSALYFYNRDSLNQQIEAVEHFINYEVLKCNALNKLRR